MHCLVFRLKFHRILPPRMCVTRVSYALLNKSKYDKRVIILLQILTVTGIYLGAKFELQHFPSRNHYFQTFPLHYRQVSNMRRTLVGNYIFGHSDVVGASPAGVAPTTSSFST